MACWVSVPDAKVELGPLRVQHESRRASFHLLSPGSQPEELDRWRAPQEGTPQPGLSPFQHGHLGLSHCHLWGFCRDREGKAGWKVSPAPGLVGRLGGKVLASSGGDREGKQRRDGASGVGSEACLGPVCCLFQDPVLCQSPTTICFQIS